MKRSIITLFLFVFLIAAVSGARADVTVVSSSSSGSSVFNINEIDINIGPGNSGDYALFSCLTTLSNGQQTFNDPVPGSWTQIDLGECAESDPEPNFCAQGIWGGLLSSQGSRDITCSWTGSTDIAAAGSIRFRGVDPAKPVIASSCNTGFSSLATAPSIETEPGSQVVRVFNFGTIFNGPALDQAPNQASRGEEEAGGVWDIAVANDFEFLRSFGRSEPFTEGGPTGTYELGTEATVRWRACTIALRMNTGVRPIPTMSEWGLFAAAGLIGIAGIYYIRRKKVQAV